MSCFVVSKKTINTIVTGIARKREQESEYWGYELSKIGHANFNPKHLAGELLSLNIAAYNGRYDEYLTLDCFPYQYQFIPASDYQLIKSIRCWLYQCSSGGDMVEMHPLYVWMEHICGMLAYGIVSKTAEYDAAEWD